LAQSDPAKHCEFVCVGVELLQYPQTSIRAVLESSEIKLLNWTSSCDSRKLALSRLTLAESGQCHNEPLRSD